MKYSIIHSFTHSITHSFPHSKLTFTGIDIGTTSTKAVVFDVSGKVLAQKSIAYQMFHPKPDWSEQNPDEIYEALKKALLSGANLVGVLEKIRLKGKIKPKNLTAAADRPQPSPQEKGVKVLSCGEDLGDRRFGEVFMQNAAFLTNFKTPTRLAFGEGWVGLDVLSFSSAMHSFMAVDEAGKPLTNLIVWADNRAVEIANDLKTSDLGKAIYAETGTPIHPFSFLCKILWFKTHEPAIFDKAHKFIGIKEYIWHKLFGHYEIDQSLASATGMMNIQDLCWDKKTLDLVEIDEKKLPKIVPTTFSRTQQEKRYFIGAADGPLANLGTGAMGRNKLAFTMGTSGAVRICVDEYYTDPQMRTFNYLLSANQHVIGGATNNGAIVMQWLKEQILQTDISTEELIEKAQKTTAGAENLLFLPYILGERAPVWNANAKGVFFGLSINHTQAHLVRAVMEGIVFNLFSVGKVLMEKFPVEEICASGGFAKSDFWLQLVADIFQKRVVISENVEGSAWGAVLVAMQALEIEPQILAQKTEKIFLPNIKNAQIYADLHVKFERLYDKLKDEF